MQISDIIFIFVTFVCLKEEKMNRLRASRYKNEGEQPEADFLLVTPLGS